MTVCVCMCACVVLEEPTVAVGAVCDVDGGAGGGAVPPGGHSVHGDGVFGGRLQIGHLGRGLGPRHRELFDVTSPTCRGEGGQGTDTESESPDTRDHREEAMKMDNTLTI